MKKIYFNGFLLFFLFVCAHAFGQVVSTKPVLPTADKPVTLVFDVSKATDSRASGIKNAPDDVYLWSGAGSTESESDAFTFQPAGQTVWTSPFAPGKMTYLGNNRWAITITPRSYFGVAAGTPIRKLGLLLKNGNGSAQTENFYVSVFPSTGVVGAFSSPVEESFFVNANTIIPVKAYTSAKADITLKVDNTVVASVQNQDSLVYNLNSGALSGVKRTVVFEATVGSETATDVFYYTVKPTPQVASLPTGIKDGINYTGATSVILSLFAPQKDFVYVIGEFNNWTPSEAYLMKRTPDGERYWLELNGLPAGQEVAFQYLVNGTIAVADPYTHKILDPNNDKYLTDANYPNLKPYPNGPQGIVSLLQTNQETFNWTVQDFKRPDPKNLVVYEMLVRDFVATRNYKTLTDTLSYFKRLGINAIELMPVMEFSGNDSWGYNPIFYLAPDKAYGTEKDLKMFIDVCHQNGIAVILDVVFNQADYEFPYVKLYWDGNKPAANSPYFNPEATHPFSVFFDFNHESPATEKFVQRVTKFWLEEYKVDGFRFDLSKGFTQKKTNEVGAWSAYDASRVENLKRIYDEVKAVEPTAYVIMEHFGDNTEEKELAAYGMLLWGNANYDYRNAAKGEATNMDWISYKKRGWQQPNVLGYIESHDEERLVYDVMQYGLSNGTYNTRSLVTALNRAKLAATFSLLVPGPKLIWQFGELGYDVSIDYNGRTGAKPLHWEYLNDSERKKLYKVYAELIKLKTTNPLFQTTDFDLAFDGMVKRMVFSNAGNTAFAVGNFDVKKRTEEAKFPFGGKWYDYFTGEAVTVKDPMEKIILEPGEFRLFTTLQLPTPEAGLLPWQNVALSAEDEMAAISTKVYPNPFKERTIIEINNNYRGLVNLKVMDVTGRVIQTEVVAKNQELLIHLIDCHTLKAGVYLLQVEIGQGRTVKRVLKTN
ncbi:alpha-amylase family glycosyl hydrolase [Pontibacter sp. MBLB2868]|uniref:alpha-amylase family glycosyl hydrolase n=1 Tax=Pontibacter sp. MBLB2868 TaxID=3451555 RepID=UPI003F74ED2A